ncbi:MAG TPA: DPP IV N-terminal domain-containing protein, partial [Woeseiaceae bacterium]|nr:DPP IV N-terminal domain-containing protein [Woeseiaceae bacterium]
MNTVRTVLYMLCFALLTAAAAAQERFSARDVFELEFASDPQISPDGREVVYVRQTNDIMTDRTRGNLWTVSSDGRDHRPLLSGRDSYSSPRWSADGTRLAYVSDAEGSQQLYVRWMDTGQTALVTNLTEAPGDIAWSPDGRWIAFSMHVSSDTKPLGTLPEKPEGAKWAAPVKVIEQTYYRSDGEGYLDPGFSHIFVVPSTGGTPRQLTEGDYNHGGPLSWTPESDAILFSANRREDWRLDPRESDVFAVTLANGELTQLTDRDGPDGSPAVSPDGEQIAYVGFDERRRGYENSILYVMNRDGSNAHALTGDFDRSVRNPTWLANGDGVLVSYEDHGLLRLGYVGQNGKLSEWHHDLSGESLGRPYTSGSFSVADNG